MAGAPTPLRCHLGVQWDRGIAQSGGDSWKGGDTLTRHGVDHEHHRGCEGEWILLCDLWYFGGNMLKEKVERETQSSCRKGLASPSFPMQTRPIHLCCFNPTLFNGVLRKSKKLHSNVSNLMQEDLTLQEMPAQILQFGAQGLYLTQALSHRKQAQHRGMQGVEEKDELDNGSCQGWAGVAFSLSFQHLLNRSQVVALGRW